jgi:hypothetical protein
MSFSTAKGLRPMTLMDIATPLGVGNPCRRYPGWLRLCAVTLFGGWEPVAPLPSSQSEGR